MQAAEVYGTQCTDGPSGLGATGGVVDAGRGSIRGRRAGPLRRSVRSAGVVSGVAVLATEGGAARRPAGWLPDWHVVACGRDIAAHPSAAEPFFCGRP